jgi:hypothetical protein
MVGIFLKANFKDARPRTNLQAEHSEDRFYQVSCPMLTILYTSENLPFLPENKISFSLDFLMHNVS